MRNRRVSMVKPLKQEILGLAEDQWKSHSGDGEVIKKCANAPYYPEE